MWVDESAYGFNEKKRKLPSNPLAIPPRYEGIPRDSTAFRSSVADTGGSSAWLPIKSNGRLALLITSALRCTTTK